MRRLSPIPALLSVVLLGACGQVFAVESRPVDAEGNCPETANAGNGRSVDAESDPNAPAAPARNGKAAATPRSSGGNRSSAPRWHSFLPGMFR